MARTENKKIDPPTEKDYELAKQTYAWMESLVDSEAAEKSDYLWNLSVYGKAGVVNAKGVGIVASAVASYQREMNEKAGRQQLASSQHVGEIGKRITSFVTVIALNPTQYGMCQKLLTPEGNVLTAFGTYLEHAEGEKKGQRVAQGDQLWVRGTVKRHSEFKGVKETVMNRPSSCLDPVNEKASKAAAAKAAKRTETLAGEVEAFDPATGAQAKFSVYDIKRADGVIVGWCVREPGKKGKQLTKCENGKAFAESSVDGGNYWHKNTLRELESVLREAARAAFGEPRQLALWNAVGYSRLSDDTSGYQYWMNCSKAIYQTATHEFAILNDKRFYAIGSEQTFRTFAEAEAEVVSGFETHSYKFERQAI